MKDRLQNWDDWFSNVNEMVTKEWWTIFFLPSYFLLSGLAIITNPKIQNITTYTASRPKEND